MMTNDEIGRRKKIGVVIILMALCTLVYTHRYFCCLIYMIYLIIIICTIFIKMH